MQKNKPNNSNEAKFITAIVVLLLLSAGLAYLYINEKKQNKGKQDQIVLQMALQMSASNKIDSLSKELALKIKEVEKMGGDISSLSAIKANLEADKKSLLSKPSIDLSKIDEKINEYKQILKEKESEIQKLKLENGNLLNENQELSNVNSGLKTEKLRLSDSVNSIINQNKELSAKVNLASALRAETINVYAISNKGKEREGGSYNPYKIEKIRISFHLAENSLTKLGSKEIFLRILEPNGSTIADMAVGSGKFVYNGQSTIYTVKKTETFTNSRQLVEFVYSRGQEYRAGKYIIELFSEGFKIGEGSFLVK